jgi:3-methylfumaryl-CoA hydratase
MNDDATMKAQFASWIGRRTERQDIIDQRLVEEYKATLFPYLADQTTPPGGIFWCLSPDTATSDKLGGDGHPKTGLFMPDLPFPRRMWAGGELVFHDEFLLDQRVDKTTTIEDIVVKSGKSGQLSFVTVRHQYHGNGKLLLEERQDIVYREPSPLTVASKPDIEARPLLDVWAVEATSTLLFRYSALTFNGHRIHYDHPYATAVEGYAGLVVHGPLQATLMLNLVSQCLGRTPLRFSYRGQSPLIAGQTFRVEAFASPERGIDARVVSAQGITTMTAHAEL